MDAEAAAYREHLDRMLDAELFGRDDDDDDDIRRDYERDVMDGLRGL